MKLWSIFRVVNELCDKTKKTTQNHHWLNVNECGSQNFVDNIRQRNIEFSFVKLVILSFCFVVLASRMKKQMFKICMTCLQWRRVLIQSNKMPTKLIYVFSVAQPEISTTRNHSFLRSNFRLIDLCTRKKKLYENGFTQMVHKISIWSLIMHT